MMISKARINALIATAYNLHIGGKMGLNPMTPDAAAKLSKGDKAALCRVLENNGGSDLYSADDCRQAFAVITGEG